MQCVGHAFLVRSLIARSFVHPHFQDEPKGEVYLICPHPFSPIRDPSFGLE